MQRTKAGSIEDVRAKPKGNFGRQKPTHARYQVNLINLNIKKFPKKLHRGDFYSFVAITFANFSY